MIGSEDRTAASSLPLGNRPWMSRVSDLRPCDMGLDVHLRLIGLIVAEVVVGGVDLSVLGLSVGVRLWGGSAVHVGLAFLKVVVDRGLLVGLVLVKVVIVVVQWVAVDRVVWLVVWRGVGRTIVAVVVVI